MGFPQKATIENEDDFELYIENSKKFGRTTATPPINEKEREKWNVKGSAPNMKNRSCEETIFLTLLSSCKSGCNGEKQSSVADRICNDGAKLTDEQIRKECCPAEIKAADGGSN
uniref:Uncharacterized protein n=1 Tax=Caenorhabditis tropicalis TaxID=1561998 RepID=A0A1I7U1V3_9PELO